MRHLTLAAFVVAISGNMVQSEPVPVSMADYAFDFPTIGYEITISGTTKNIQDKLTADDYINIEDEGYTMKTLIDRMGRKDRQKFIAFFNENCITGFVGDGCDITTTGEVELDENMRMIFRMMTATIGSGSSSWSNAGSN